MDAKRLSFSLGRTRDAPIADQRKRSRTLCAIPAYLFDNTGAASPATIMDRSQAGVRILCSEGGFHLKACHLLRLDTGAAYALRRVWYADEIGGYEFIRRVDGQAPRADLTLQAIAAAWSEHQLTSVRLQSGPGS